MLCVATLRVKTYQYFIKQKKYMFSIFVANAYHSCFRQETRSSIGLASLLAVFFLFGWERITDLGTRLFAGQHTDFTGYTNRFKMDYFYTAFQFVLGVLQ